MSKSSLLREYADCRGVVCQIDREAATIRGVKVLGLVSRNGREYPADTIARAAPLYEGAKVNVNHPRAPAGPGEANPRDYQDRLGTLRAVRVSPDGLFADLHFNPKHALAEQLLWDAEHSPENVGLSHHVAAHTRTQDGKTIVDEITRVLSVDLVADPATTAGLFEEAESLRGELARLQAREEIAKRQAETQAAIDSSGLPAEIISPLFREQLLAADEAKRRELLEDRRRCAELAAVRFPAPRSLEQRLAESNATRHDHESFVAAIRR